MNSRITELLTKLGLTEYESRSLAALFKAREADAPTISRMAEVPKTRVYDVLEKLTNYGIVIELAGRPKKYRVIAPMQAIENLLERRMEEINKLKKDIEQFKTSLEKIEFAESNERVIKIKDKNDFYAILAQELANANNEIIGFSSIDRKQLKNILAEPSKKRVKIMLLHPEHKEETANLKIKTKKHNLDAFVVDNNKAIIALSNINEDKPMYHLAIIERNKDIANALKHYFKKHWQE